MESYPPDTLFEEPFSFEYSPLFLPEPSMPVAFFKGPLFLANHGGKLDEFYNSVKTPFEILEDSKRRRGLEETISKLCPTPNLFGDENLPRLLDSMRDQGHLYQQFSQKVGEKRRSFSVPQNHFKYFLEEYLTPFIKNRPVHKKSHGGEPGWSVEKSLRTHTPLRSSICFDMQDAFGQAEIPYVFSYLYEQIDPFALSEEETRDTAGFLSSLVTVGRNSRVIRYPGAHLRSGGGYNACLPQGSSLSMALFNRMMSPIDEEIEKYSKDKGLRYSRWVDDFIISSPKLKAFQPFETALRLAQNYASIAPEKIFFYRGTPSYLLGHRVIGERVQKVDKETFKKERGEPLTGYELSNTHPRGENIYYESEEFYPDDQSELFSGDPNDIPF